MAYRVNTKRRQKGYGSMKKKVRKAPTLNFTGRFTPPTNILGRAPRRKRRQKGQGAKWEKFKRGVKKTKHIWGPIARAGKNKLVEKIGVGGVRKKALDAAYDAALDSALN